MMITEADEAATSKETALANLRDQIAADETMGVIAMYERAAWGVGATAAETEPMFGEGRALRKFLALPLAMLRALVHEEGLQYDGLDQPSLARRLAASGRRHV